MKIISFDSEEGKIMHDNIKILRKEINKNLGTERTYLATFPTITDTQNIGLAWDIGRDRIFGSDECFDLLVKPVERHRY